MAHRSELPLEVQAWLDVAAECIRKAHGRARMLESGKAITEYLRLQHDIGVCLHDLDIPDTPTLGRGGGS